MRKTRANTALMFALSDVMHNPGDSQAFVWPTLLGCILDGAIRRIDSNIF